MTFLEKSDRQDNKEFGMKLILENWREFRKEALNERTDFEVMASIGRSAYSGKKMKYPGRSLTKDDLETMRILISMADPTGILSWKDVADDYKKYTESPSLASAGWLMLSLVSAIPLFGKLAAPAKAAKLAKVADVAKDTSKVIAKRWDSLGPMRAVDEAFKSGVINMQDFFAWYKKTINPKAPREELLGAWKDTKKLFGDIVESDQLDPVDLYRAADGQFKKILQKYNVGVDPNIGKGGWVMSLAQSNPSVYNKYIKDLQNIKKIPTVSTGFAIGADVAGMVGKGAGSRLFRTLFHEIGHMKFIQNFPSIAGKFLKEYRRLIVSRIKQIQSSYGLTDDMLVLGDDLLKSTLHVMKEYQKQNINKLLQMGLNNKQVMALYQSAVLKRTMNQIGDANPKKIKVFLSDIVKNENYELFRTGTKEIASLLGINPEKVRKFYFLNFEETFAELFEKSVRKVAGGGSAASKNFPETAVDIQKIINKEIIPNLRESILKNKKYKLLISTKKQTI
jgi:hypothetical protein